jgi:hypothetical protein
MPIHSDPAMMVILAVAAGIFWLVIMLKAENTDGW